MNSQRTGRRAGPDGPHDVLEMMGRLRTYTTIFYATHLLDDMQRVSDAVAILNHGGLVAQAPIEELLVGSGETIYLLVTEGDVGEAYTRVADQAWVSGIKVTPGDGQKTCQVGVTDEEAAKPALYSQNAGLVPLTSDAICCELLVAASIRRSQTLSA